MEVPNFNPYFLNVTTSYHPELPVRELHRDNQCKSLIIFISGIHIYVRKAEVNYKTKWNEQKLNRRKSHDSDGLGWRA